MREVAAIEGMTRDLGCTALRCRTIHDCGANSGGGSDGSAISGLLYVRWPLLGAAGRGTGRRSQGGAALGNCGQPLVAAMPHSPAGHLLLTRWIYRCLREICCRHCKALDAAAAAAMLHVLVVADTAWHGVRLLQLRCYVCSHGTCC